MAEENQGMEIVSGDDARKNVQYYSQFYEEIVGDRPDNDFYLNYALRANGPVLDVGCNNGRLLQFLVQHGIDVYGVEPDLERVEMARERLAPFGVPPENIIQGYGQDFSFQRTFGLVLFGFRTFQLIIEPEEQRQTLENVRRHLSPGGQLILDVFNPSVHFLAQDIDPRVERNIQILSRPEGDVLFSEQVLERDLFKQRQTGRDIFYVPEGDHIRRLAGDYESTYFFPQELHAMLRSSGFNVDSTFGEFDSTPFGQQQYPGELIVVSTKPVLQRSLQPSARALSANGVNRKKTVVLISADGDKAWPINQLISLGYNVAFFGATSHDWVRAFDSNPAVKLFDCDISVIQSLLPRVESFAQQSTSEISAIVAFDEFAVMQADIVRSALGASSTNISTLLSSSNKLSMKRALENGSVPTATYIPVNSVEHGRELLDTLKFPFLVKPAVGSGSSGIKVVRSKDEYDDVMKYSEVDQTREDASFKNPDEALYFFEELLEGDIFSCDGFVVDGKLFFLPTNQIGTDPENFLQYLNRIGFQIDPELEQALRDVTTQAVDALGFGNSPFHCELIVDADGPKILEIAARIPGGKISEAYLDSTGVNLVEKEVALRSGTFTWDEFDILPVLQRGIFTGKEGTIAGIDTSLASEFISNQYVNQFVQILGVGDAVVLPPQLPVPVFYYELIGDTPEILAELDARLIETLNVDVSPSLTNEQLSRKFREFLDTREIPFDEPVSVVNSGDPLFVSGNINRRLAEVREGKQLALSGQVQPIVRCDGSYHWLHNFDMLGAIASIEVSDAGIAQTAEQIASFIEFIAELVPDKSKLAIALPEGDSLLNTIFADPRLAGIARLEPHDIGTDWEYGRDGQITGLGSTLVYLDAPENDFHGGVQGLGNFITVNSIGHTYLDVGFGLEIVRATHFGGNIYDLPEISNITKVVASHFSIDDIGKVRSLTNELRHMVNLSNCGIAPSAKEHGYELRRSCRRFATAIISTSDNFDESSAAIAEVLNLVDAPESVVNEITQFLVNIPNGLDKALAYGHKRGLSWDNPDLKSYAASTLGVPASVYDTFAPMLVYARAVDSA